MTGATEVTEATTGSSAEPETDAVTEPETEPETDAELWSPLPEEIRKQIERFGKAYDVRTLREEEPTDYD